jgi:hypothetical protein
MSIAEDENAPARVEPGEGVSCQAMVWRDQGVKG